MLKAKLRPRQSPSEGSGALMVGGGAQSPEKRHRDVRLSAGPVSATRAEMRTQCWSRRSLLLPSLCVSVPLARSRGVC